MNKSLILAVLCIVAIGALIYTLTASDDEKLILEHLEQVATLSTITANEHPVARLTRIRELTSLFSDTLTFEFELKDIQPFTIEGKKQFEQKLHAGASYFDKLEVAFEDTEVTLDSSKADAISTVSILGSASDEEGDFFERHRVSMELSNESGEWLISQVKHLENLRE